uniref:Uncharacterized protein n=1 Tax=Arundo donax TaxID=35708 RepID=A0A0A9GNI3_ARUDO
MDFVGFDPMISQTHTKSQDNLSKKAMIINLADVCPGSP